MYLPDTENQQSMYRYITHMRVCAYDHMTVIPPEHMGRGRTMANCRKGLTGTQSRPTWHRSLAACLSPGVRGRGTYHDHSTTLTVQHSWFVVHVVIEQ